MRNAILISMALGCVATFGGPTGASAQEDLQAKLREYLVRASQPIVDVGFQPTGRVLEGTLATGANEGLSIELEAGRDYALVGACDGDCSDMDLEVYDQAGNEIDSDLEYDDVPVVRVTADRSGAYRLVVGMVTCSNEPCYWAVREHARTALQPDEQQQLVLDQLDAFGAELEKQGYQRTHGLRIFALDQAENQEFMIRLKAGTTYAIAAFCDRGCSDLDLAIFADGVEPVAQDTESNDHPAIDLEVTGTGVFKFRVNMATCTSSPCIYGVALHGKPTAAPSEPAEARRQADAVRR
jgi:hypothetical protein